MTPATTAITMSMARRSPGVSGSVGGVLPVLTVGGSFVRRTRSIHNKRISSKCSQQHRKELRAISSAGNLTAEQSRSGGPPECHLDHDEKLMLSDVSGDSATTGDLHTWWDNYG